MALEIEIKVRVDGHDAVRQRLREIGARRVCGVLEVNRILDTPDRRLLADGCGLRVRTCTGDGDVPAPALTYKGCQRPGDVKIREELETDLADSDTMLAILRALGYSVVIQFEKRRERYKHGDITIELDEVPRLGRFVEIEGPDEQTVRDLQTRLGIAGDPINKSYIALLVEHAEQHGLPYDSIQF